MLILDDSYAPSTITVAVNDTVTWQVYATHFHSVTSDSGLFDSSPPCPSYGCLGPGAEYVYKFTAAGTYNYHCKVHATMHGTVKVT